MDNQLLVFDNVVLKLIVFYEHGLDYVDEVIKINEHEDIIVILWILILMVWMIKLLMILMVL